MRRKLGRLVISIVWTSSSLKCGHIHTHTLTHRYTQVYTDTTQTQKRKILLHISNCDFEGGTSVWILLPSVFCSDVLLQSMAQVSLINQQSPDILVNRLNR